MIPVLGCHVLQETEVGDAGVCNQKVQCGKVPVKVRKGLGAGSAVADIREPGDNAHTGRAAECRAVFELFLLFSREQKEVVAGLGELQGNRAAYAAGSSGQESCRTAGNGSIRIHV